MIYPKIISVEPISIVREKDHVMRGSIDVEHQMKESIDRLQKEINNKKFANTLVSHYKNDKIRR
jgi:hypothetical protein